MSRRLYVIRLGMSVYRGVADRAGITGFHRACLIAVEPSG